MDIKGKIERSKINPKFSYTKIKSLNKSDELVEIKTAGRIIVEPIWTVLEDLEGRQYAKYISGHPEYDGIYVRSELLKRLMAASTSLDKKYKIVVRAGHRPLSVQMNLLQGVAKGYKKRHPTVSDKEALEHAQVFVSNPDIELPPHCSGAAVDVYLQDADAGEPLDFGGKVNDDSERSYLHDDTITDVQQSNRMILLTAMLEAGLSSYYEEWWHYSYGDQYWAWFYGKEQCLYGIVEK
jgi:zinc D-Ala-D-Ala dipeptidase